MQTLAFARASGGAHGHFQSSTLADSLHGLKVKVLLRLLRLTQETTGTPPRPAGACQEGGGLTPPLSSASEPLNDESSFRWQTRQTSKATSVYEMSNDHGTQLSRKSSWLTARKARDPERAAEEHAGRTARPCRSSASCAFRASSFDLVAGLGLLGPEVPLTKAAAGVGLAPAAALLALVGIKRGCSVCLDEARDNVDLALRADDPWDTSSSANRFRAWPLRGAGLAVRGAFKSARRKVLPCKSPATFSAVEGRICGKGCARPTPSGGLCSRRVDIGCRALALRL